MGVAIGVGAATSPFVALLLVPALALLLRDRRLPDAGVFVSGAVAAWTALMIPAVASSPEAWLTSWKGYFHGADIGSAWLLASQVADVDPSNRVILIGTALMLAAHLRRGGGARLAHAVVLRQPRARCWSPRR